MGETGTGRDRVLAAVTGIDNIRDLGGYRARGGVIGRNRLFRSGHLAQATAADHAVLRRLGLELVVDLRHPSEHARAPSVWPGPGRPRIVEDETAPGGDSPRQYFTDAMRDGGDAAAAMTTFYRQAPFDPRYRTMFRRAFLALSAMPASGGCALIHCAAGKDRTGLLVALLHHALGVAHDDIVADYLLTNAAGRPRERVAHYMQASPPMDEAALLTLLTVAPDYLDAAFAAAAERCGSVDRYVAEYLGVGPEVVAAIAGAVVI